ncbi:hypothetical protein [Streptomyces sp. BBFR102]|uniref:hypothetical protein n=1 Tax=Streptomyces sp. BBFR102 TaxID=3448171 RepID=UPI003F52D0B5
MVRTNGPKWRDDWTWPTKSLREPVTERGCERRLHRRWSARGADSAPAAAEVTSVTTTSYGDVGDVRVRCCPDGEPGPGFVERGGMPADGLRRSGGAAVSHYQADPGRAMATVWVQGPPGPTMPAIVVRLLGPLASLFAILVTVRRRGLRRECARLAAA